MSSIPNKEFPLVFKCKALGDEAHAIVLKGNPYNVPKFKGRGHGIGIGQISDAFKVTVDADLTSMAIRKSDDKSLKSCMRKKQKKQL